MSETRTFRDLIHEKGVAAISEAIGCKTNNVYVMRHRNKIHRDHWPELQLKLGLSLDDLLSMERASEA